MSDRLSISQLKTMLRIEDVVRSEGISLTGNSGQTRFVAHCPFHQGDHTPSFTLYLESQSYYCFGCGAGGDVIDFVEQFHHCSRREAIERLSNPSAPYPPASPHKQIQEAKATYEVTPSKPSPQQLALLSLAQSLYQESLLSTPRACLYLKERGISLATAQACGLGYANGSRLLTDLKDRQDLLLLARQIGLLTAEDHERLTGRLIIPEIGPTGCLWLIGRMLPQAGHTLTKSAPKYLNVSLPKPLLGYETALTQLTHPAHKKVQAILVVEGALDYVLARQWRLPVLCVALLGTHASSHQIEALQDLCAHAEKLPALLSLDWDEAGQRGSKHLLEDLQGLKNPIAQLPQIAGCKDLGDLALRPHAREQALASLNTLFARLHHQN